MGEMSETPEILTVEERLARLEALLVQTHLPDDAIVGADYVARLFGCSEAAVVRKRFGTGNIPRCRLKPLGFRKGDAHRVLREKNRPLAAQMAELRASAKERRPRRRKSEISGKSATI